MKFSDSLSHALLVGYLFVAITSCQDQDYPGKSYWQNAPDGDIPYEEMFPRNDDDDGDDDNNDREDGDLEEETIPEEDGDQTPEEDGDTSDEEEVYSVTTQRLSTAFSHSCFIREDHSVVCWGKNNAGQLGDESSENHSNPVDVAGIPTGTLAILTGGNFSCTLQDGGAALCWGKNDYGQLGDGTTINRLHPVDVRNTSEWISRFDTGNAFACALLGKGSVQCWGQNNAGQLGNGSEEDSILSVSVQRLEQGTRFLSLGSLHACAIRQQGDLVCWGDNVNGQLGDGTWISATTPVDVEGLDSNVQAVSAAESHTCALKTNGSVLCWGANVYGQLGNGTQADSKTAVQVSSLESGVKAISAGARHSCAILEGGSVVCWGNNVFGQLGDGTIETRTTPVNVQGLTSPAKEIQAGNLHTCTLLESNEVFCWGDNTYGQLGNGNFEGSLLPAPVLIGEESQK